jgi:hypothetical protein
MVLLRRKEEETMGHTYRELYPEQAEASDRYWDRVNKIRERLRAVPSGELTIGQLITALRVMGAFHGDTDPQEAELEEMKSLLDERDRKRRKR